MKVRLGFRAWLVIILAIGVLIYDGVSSLVDNVSGCGKSSLEAFENHEIALEYQNAYIIELTTELKSEELNPSQIGKINGYSWNITKYSRGCKVQFIVNATKGYQQIKYSADEFLINKEESRIYPISEGAKLFLEYYDIDNKITLP